MSPAPAAAVSLGDAAHAVPLEQLPAATGTDLTAGLSAAEAARRLARDGANAVEAATGRGPLRRLADQVDDPLVYVLIAAAVLSAVLRQLVEASVIAAVVVLNALAGAALEARAERALQSLAALTRTSATVVRDGRTETVDSAQLVVGDVVSLAAGDRVPADCRVVRGEDLRVDESSLTGESVPVTKGAGDLPAETALADRCNTVHAGTLVTHGSARVVVVGTGEATALGHVHSLVARVDALQTPLTRQLARFSRTLTAAVVALAAVTFAAGVLRGQDWTAMFTAAVALAVGAIPESLPAAVTIILAVGVSRITRRRALVRRLPAVETLGATTVICTDKTGTLTQNEMTVVAVVVDDQHYVLTGSGYAPEGQVLHDGAPVPVADRGALRDCLVAGALCNDAALDLHEGRWTTSGDPMEAALLVAAVKAGVDLAEEAGRAPRTSTLPFDAQSRLMATWHGDDAGTRRLVVKGAPEEVLALTSRRRRADGTTAGADVAQAQRVVDDAARRGLRVLAVAGADVDVELQASEPGVHDLRSSPLMLLGLLLLQDPPRTTAAGAVRACRRAGIEVKMVTGDHPATAAAIASAVGIGRSELGHADSGTGGVAPEVVTGAQLAASSDAQLAAAAERAVVFARVSPEQKLALVRALQAAGHVVAVTGDGVNDAPALRQADIGVAMGAGGTEVAKEAADMVLTDDDFATVEAAVEEGRGAYDNITKFVTWTLPTNVAEGLVIVTAVLLGTTLPLLPVQVLWINMTTALALGLPLAFEPREPGVMDRPPRDPGRALLDRTLAGRLLLVSALLVAGSFGLFAWERAHGADLATARTVAVDVFVAVQITYLVNCRSRDRSVLTVGLLSNPWAVAGAVLTAALQALFTYLPAMNRVFQTAPIDLAAWGRIAVVAVAASAVVALDKRVRRARSTRPGRSSASGVSTGST